MYCLVLELYIKSYALAFTYRITNSWQCKGTDLHFYVTHYSDKY